MARWISAGLWLAPALGALLAWSLLIQARQPQFIADERIHHGVIEKIAAGEPAPANLPMLPAYHYLVAAVSSRLGGANLARTRGVTTALAACAILALWAAARTRALAEDDTHARFLTLVFNPIWFALAPLAYTETAAQLGLALILLGLAREWPWLAVAGLACSAAARQSNLAWIPLVAAWIAHSAWRRAPQTQRARTLALALAPLALVLLLPLAPLALGRRLVPPPNDPNQARLNVAQIYLYLLTLAVVFAPCLLIALARQRRILLNLLSSGWRAALLLAAVGAVWLGFLNPHPWNGDTNYLRNLVLVALQTDAVFRMVCAAVIVVSLGGWAALSAEQPRRVRWLALTAFACAYVGVHWLADPRYYIAPILLMNFAMHAQPAILRAQAAWQILLSAALAGFVWMHGNVHGGVP